MLMIEDFLNYLRYERNRSELTVCNYEQSLRDFEAYFKNRDSQLSWESVDSDIIRDWMESLMDKGDMASTVNNRLSAVRSFFRFALSRGMVDRDPSHLVKGPKRQKPLPYFMREDDMNRLIDLPQMCGDDYSGFAAHQLKVTGKRNKQRIIPFGKELEQTLTEYMELREQQPVRADSKALIRNDKGERISRFQVEKIVHDCLSLVTTQKKRSPHVLRHSFATAMLNNGAGLENVQKLLGHESVATTEIYTHTTFEQLKKAYENAHPRA